MTNDHGSWVRPIQGRFGKENVRDDGVDRIDGDHDFSKANKFNNEQDSSRKCLAWKGFRSRPTSFQFPLEG